MIFLSLYVFLFAPVQSSLQIEEGRKEIILSIQELAYYEDELNELTFEQIILPSFQPLFKVTPDFKPEDYIKEATYWVKLELQLPDFEGDYIFEFYDQTIDSIDVFLTSDALNFRHIKMGDALPFGQKGIDHKNFEVILNSGSQYLIYTKIKNSQYADIRIAIKRIDRFIQYSLGEYLLYGLFYGMILIISLYNVLIFTAIKEKKYLYYTLYILSVGLYAMSIDGIAYQYLWPNQPVLNQYAHGVALFLVIFWSILFSFKFLNTKQRAPKFHKVLVVVFIGRIILFLVAILFARQLFQFRNIEIIPLLLIFVSSIAVLIRGYKPARFFVVAYGLLFMGFIFKALLMESVIPFSIVTYYSLHICFILEMLFLTYALSDRVRILKNNRDRALKRIVLQHEQNIIVINRINRNLERQVEKRTEDLNEKNYLLEESNAQISEQSREIAQINSLLDLDNWRLKNNINKIQKKRLTHTNLSYDEFNDVFQSNERCLEILADHKWANGYSCKKCGNEKFIEQDIKLARRCTKCGYSESPTAFTVFKGLKFELLKAFYIIYTQLNQDRFTLDELATKLEMRRNTVWNFKKRVDDELQSHGEIYLSSLLNFGYETSLGPE